MYMASDMYFEGHGVNPDKIKAFSLIKKSAELKKPKCFILYWRLLGMVMELKKL